MKRTTKLLTAGAIVLGLGAASFAMPADARGRADCGPSWHQSHGFGPGFWRGHGKRHGMHHRRGPHRGMMMERLIERYSDGQEGEITIEDVTRLRADELRKYDTNGDGELGLEEYEALWLDRTRERMVRSFQRYDRDGDAQVTVEEYNRPIERMEQRMERRSERGTKEKRYRRDRPMKKDESGNEGTSD